MVLDPTLAQAHAATGYVWVTPQTLDKAISYFKKATQLNPNYSDAHLWLSNFINDLGDYSEAYPILEKAARLDPLSRPAVGNHASELIFRNRLAEADQQLQKLVSIDPEFVAASGLLIDRASVGGEWADGLLAGLESLSINPEPASDNPLAIMFAVIGLEEEALALAGASLIYVQRYLGKPREQLVSARERNTESPDSLFARLGLGLALAGTADYTSARPFLEESWQTTSMTVTRYWFTAEHALAMIAARRQAGDEVGVARMVAAIRDNVRRYREAGISPGDLFSSVDFEDGVATYLSGGRERGLALIARAVQSGYVVPPNQAYLQWLYDDSGFDPIQASQEARQARERTKFLAIVCADNPYADFWTPADKTCETFAALRENPVTVMSASD
jgi:tetratricopeptide (TPR) repeat protein